MSLRNMLVGALVVLLFFTTIRFADQLHAANVSLLALANNSKVIAENKIIKSDNLNFQEVDPCVKDYSEKDLDLLYVKNFSVLENGEVSWTSVHASPKVSYLLEQCMLDKWVVVKSIPMFNSFSIKTVTHVFLNSGENKLRLVRKEKKKKNICSEIINVFCNKTPVTFLQKQNALIFSEKSYIKVMYQTGDVYFEGYATSLNISNYYSGSYTIIYDNKSEVFSIKKNAPFMKNL